VILFARNWKDRAQLSAAAPDIKAVRADLLICVDHEGGRVQRFRTDGFTHLPPMRAWVNCGCATAPGSGALRATNAATACGLRAGRRAAGLRRGLQLHARCSTWTGAAAA
jgi:beta-N-acetylhexosaminidase